MRRQAFNRILLGVLAAGGLAAAAFVGFADSASTAGSGVLHARFVAADGRVLREEFLDRRTGATRSIEHEPNLPAAGGDYVTIRTGSRITSWYTDGTGEVYSREVVDSADPWLDDASELLRPSRMVAAGKARIAGSGVVRGRPVDRVELATGAFAEIDRETRLPVRYTVATAGRTETVDVQTEQAGESGTSLFEARPLPTMTDRRVRFGDLAASVAFPVYTLGPAYRGLRFGASNFRERRPDPTLRFQPKPELFIGYVAGNAYDDPVVSLSEHAMGTDDANARFRAFREQGAVRTVVIAGAERTVYLLDEDTQPVYFATVIGDTLVNGRANLSSAAVLDLLASLRRAP